MMPALRRLADMSKALYAYYLTTLSCIGRRCFVLGILTVLSLQIHVTAQRAQWRAARNCVELNSSADDFAPVLYGGSHLFFNSERSSRSLFYLSLILPDGYFDAPKSADEPLNPTHGGRSYLTFSPSGGALLSSFRKANGRSYLNIAATDTTGGLWSAPKFLPEFLSDDFNAQPAVSPDGSMLAFSSDRSGGAGGADLWFSYRMPSGSWGTPVHGGDIINSPGHEITPFFASDDTLYFASDGFGGEGGFEVFMTTLDKGSWSPPEPLAEINTEYDESDFTQIRSDAALFCSNRPGGQGGLDIFFATRGTEAFAVVPPVEAELAVQTFSASVRSRVSAEPIMTFALFAKNSAEFVPKADSNILRSLQTISRRMNDNIAASLTLTGWTDKSAPQETLELAAKRAENIRSFFIRNGIEKNRIIVRAAEHPVGESGGDLLYRVDFGTSDAELFKNMPPSTDSYAIFEPAALECIADARPRSSIKSWTCIAAGDTLATGRDIPHKFSVKTSRAARKAADTILLTFSVTDTLGREFRSTSAIPLARITTSDGNRPTADAIIAATDPLRALEAAEPILVAADRRITLYAGRALRTPDAADLACDLIRRRYGSSRAEIRRVDKFAEILPKNLRTFSKFLLLIESKSAVEK